MQAAKSSSTSFEPSEEALAQAVTQLVTLIDAESLSGREEPAIAATLTICAELGLPARRMPAGPGRDNVVVGPERAEIVLCTHLDTVPPFIGATVDATHVHGRGACDAKGIAVAMLHALRAVRAAYPAARERVGCLLVVGEETDHLGAKAAVAAGIRPRHVLLGEPCGLLPAVAQKGLLKLELAASGQAGHSAYPEVGTSAVHLLLDALGALRAARLPADETLGETTVNVGAISGGVAANVIAPDARASVLIRCAAPVDAVLNAVHGVLPPGVALAEVSRAEPRDFDVLGAERGETGPAVPFNTDANVLAATGARLTLFGPGDMRCAHAPREKLAIADLARGIAAYAGAITRLL